MTVAKSAAGYVVVVRGWGFVTASALLTRRGAEAMRKRLERHGLKARIARRAAA